MKSIKIEKGENGFVAVEIDGVYYSDVKNDGMVSFERSFEYDDDFDIAINDDNWIDALGEEHLFVELFNNVEGVEIEAEEDYVMIMLPVDKLCEYAKRWA